MKKYLFSFILLLSLSFTQAQSYSNNREKFVKEIQKIMKEYGKSDVDEFLKKELAITLLETSDFSDAYFSKMVETCNLMEVKKLKPYPEIYQYVFSVYSFVKAKQPQASFNAWHSSVDKMLDSKNVPKFKDFIELSAGFFSKRKISEESGFSWFYRGGTYSFEFTDKPFMKFEGGNLVCLVENTDKKSINLFIDSIVVTGSKGTYDPVIKRYIGDGGNVTWEKVGLPKDKTFAQLKNYSLSLKTSNLNVDTVLLTTPYFAKPIMGQFSERAFKINREEDKVYPSFVSFEKRLKIKNIHPNVDYDGGFSLRGKDFVGVGTPKEPATVIIYKDTKPFALFSSQLFVVNQEKIASYLSSATIRIAQKDSIFHPGLDILYEVEKKTLSLVRGKSGISQAPFLNSYHMVDMYVPKLMWLEKDSELLLTYDFGMSQEQKVARLESRDFFDIRLYDKLQGLESTHPLVALYNFTYKFDEYYITEGKAASALAKTVDQAKPILLELSQYGFISYDTDSKMVTVNRKLGTFVNAKSGKSDFDNLSFISDLRPLALKGYEPKEIKENPKLQELQRIYDQKNAKRKLLNHFGKINLVSLDIELDAVDRVTISDPQNTHVFPFESKIVMKKNRNFDFSGWVNAGKLEWNTSQSHFSYIENTIHVLSSKEGLFRVRPFSEKDGKEPIVMGSSITAMSGMIKVDDVNNRSGGDKKITHFPILTVTNSPVVYYNNHLILKGAYDSTRFFFTLDPFELDSLDNFKENNLKLSGELTSAGIFPKFREKLIIMPDYSFGFSTKAPEVGYDFYSSNSKYNNKIVLSNNGLQGAGKIDFILSTSESKAFTFLPDSTIGIAKFVNRPSEINIQYPDVFAEEAMITYIPKSKLLRAKSTLKSKLSMFGDEGKLNGTLLLKESGMTGYGIINMKDANIESRLYTFKRWDLNADTSTFNLKNKYSEDEENTLAFKTDDVKAFISFESRKGVFSSNKGETKVEFPVNQYYCLMDQFTWFMDQEGIEMSKGNKSLNTDISIDAGVDIAKPNFYSLHPKQDTLQFRSTKARFSVKEKTIYCFNTEYIDVADARIFPDSSKVIIRKKAYMDPLNNSKIVANYVSKYHLFHNANTVITARRAYTSVGDYPYYDADSIKTIIKMDRIYVDSSYQTVALGKIESDLNFKLSKQFDYYGIVKIKAASPLITFNGATRIMHTCSNFTKSWMSFNSEINPKNIQIPVSNNMKTLEGLPISAGIVWRDSRDPDSVKLYPTFLSSMVSDKDPILITANGMLQYDPKYKEYQIASTEKLLNKEAPGNFIALHVPSCSLNGMGKINLGNDFGEVKVETVGTVKYSQKTGETTLNLTAKFSIPIDKNSWESIADKINKVEGLTPMDLNKTTIEQAYVEWISRDAADKFKEEYITKGSIKKLPKEFGNTLIITGLKLKSFDKKEVVQKGLISDMEDAVIVNMYDKVVLKYLPLKAFFQQVYSENVTGDKFNVYISAPGGNEYFWDYSMTKKEGELRIITNDGDYEKVVTEIKDDKKKSKNFRYEISSNRELLGMFMRLFGEE